MNHGSKICRSCGLLRKKDLHFFLILILEDGCLFFDSQLYGVDVTKQHHTIESITQSFQFFPLKVRYIQNASTQGRRRNGGDVGLHAGRERDEI